MDITNDVTTDSETLNASNSSFCHPEIKDLDNKLQQNITNLKHLIDRIRDRIPSDHSHTTEDAVSKAVQENYENLQKLIAVVLEGGRHLKKDTEDLKKLINETLEEISVLENDIEELKSLESSYEKALKYYMDNFNISVEVENQTENNEFWVKVTFREKTDLHIRFLINFSEKTVKDFDAHTFLSLDQEKSLKEQYNETDDIFMLITSLRTIVLNSEI